MPLLSEADRHREILNYISTHQGCLKEEAYDALVDKLSRNTFFKDLRKLIEEGKIIVKSKNKRDTSLYIDKSNPLIYVPEQLEEFKYAFTQLLNVSAKRIKEKDFSKIAQILGISETDPAKWSVEDSTKFIQYENRMLNKSIKGESGNRAKRRIKSMKQFDKDIVELTDRGSKNEFKSIEEEILSIKEDIALSENLLSLMKQNFTPRIDEQLEYQQIRSHEVILMTINPMRIYLVLVDIITSLSLTLWSNVLRDGKALKKLYADVYSKIAQIQFKLSSFLITLPIFKVFDPTQFLMSTKLEIEMKQDMLLGITKDYRALNMRPEIESVLKSIFSIGTDLQKFGYHVGIDRYDEVNNEQANNIEKIERDTSLLKDRLRNIEMKLKNM